MLTRCDKWNVNEGLHLSMEACEEQYTSDIFRLIDSRMLLLLMMAQTKALH